MLWKKLRAFPQWLSVSRFFTLLACYGYGLVVGFKPSWRTGRIRLGESLTRLERFNAAVVCWQEAVSLWPDWVEANERLGDALLSIDRFDEGIGWWRKAISLQVDDRYSDLYRRSASLLHRGQADAMVDILRMGMEVQEDFAQAHQLDKLGIRFLCKWTYAIGHMALLDIFVKMGILGWRSPYRPIVLDSEPANRCYLGYWSRYLPDMITDETGVEMLAPLASRLEAHMHLVSLADGQKMYHIEAARVVQAKWEIDGRSPLLTLTDSDTERGLECLQSLGVPPDAWFVGLHVRDTDSKNGRDADIGTYRLAMESIVNRGGWVIRMGDQSMSPMPSMPRVIDYAHSDARSDWMDVFLWARCRFFVGTRSGPAYVPPTFGVPCVLTNQFPIAMPFPYQNIGIFKLYWSDVKQRLLTFDEAFTSRVELADDTAHLVPLKIRPVDNTPDEINDLVLEMLDSLEGRIECSKEDERLQTRFKMLKPNYNNQLGLSPGRVGREFLRKYASLLLTEDETIETEQVG